MALIYNVYERVNKIPNAKMARMAVAYNRQIRQISTKELAEDISDRCTLHRSDVRAVLDALSLTASNYLLNGFGVQLGDLGSLSMRIKCKAAPSVKEFKPEHISGARIRFTPSVEICSRVKACSFMSAHALQQDATEGGAPATPDETKPNNSDTKPGNDSDVVNN